MTTSRLFHFWLPKWADDLIDNYQQQQKITTKTMAILHLLRYGDSLYCLITNQEKIVVNDSAMRILADTLTEQQLQYLTKIAIEKLGEEKVERIRQRVRESKP